MGNWGGGAYLRIGQSLRELDKKEPGRAGATKRERRTKVPRQVPTKANLAGQAMTREKGGSESRLMTRLDYSSG